VNLDEQGPFDVWALNLEVTTGIDAAFEEHLGLSKRGDASDGDDLSIRVEPRGGRALGGPSKLVAAVVLDTAFESRECLSRVLIAARHDGGKREDEAEREEEAFGERRERFRAIEWDIE